MPHEEYIPFENITPLHIHCLFQYMRTDGVTLQKRANVAGCRDVKHYKCQLGEIMSLSNIWRGNSKAQKLKLIERFFVRWDEYERKKKLMDDPMF